MPFLSPFSILCLIFYIPVFLLWWSIGFSRRTLPWYVVTVLLAIIIYPEPNLYLSIPVIIQFIAYIAAFIVCLTIIGRLYDKFVSKKEK